MWNNFASSNTAEYYWQKPHYNLGNKIVHSDLYKKLNPLRARFDWTPNDYTHMPWFLGVVPNAYWTYGNLDYSFKKYHRLYQAHDDWYPDRKAKTLGSQSGGQQSKHGRESVYMLLQPMNIPKGCFREIRNYHLAKNNSSPEASFQEKINIMEVCPDHVLEALREKKKHYLRAEAIDNETYKRAMSVSDFNKGRSVSELKLKTWDYGKHLRTDTYFQDDRWNPTKYSHPHRFDNVNFPEQEYKDFFGGTVGDAAQAEAEKHRLNFSGSTSQAIQDHQSARRIAKLKEVTQQVDALNHGHGNVIGEHKGH